MALGSPHVGQGTNSWSEAGRGMSSRHDKKALFVYVHIKEVHLKHNEPVRPPLPAQISESVALNELHVNAGI